MFSSKNILILCCLTIFCVSFFYYPKWNKIRTEATIGWDVSGYYWYLPSIFIYKDIKKTAFKDEIFKEYYPTPDYQQAFIHEKSGNYVMKYSAGMAVLYTPFFLVSHALAAPLGYKADGFSLPYQFGIQFGSVIMCFIGLFYLRKTLLYYFKDKTVALLLLAYVFASNYLNYAAIDGAMTHNWLFSLYALLLYHTHHFYKTPNIYRAVMIGFVIGLSALARPTEILGAMIPLFWGMSSLGLSAIKERFAWFGKHIKLYATAIIVTALVGSIQLIYWKYASGDWVVYSYEDQGFSFLKPHLWDYSFSWRSGWLTYSPVMILAFIGMFHLYQRKIHLVPILGFLLLNLWIVSAWDIWWYGGRAMVQSYPVFAFPLAAFFETLSGNKMKRYLTYSLMVIFTYYNVWWTHQCHLGGLVQPYDMTKAYLFRVIGRYEVPEDVAKLFDTKELFEGERKDVKLVYENNFDSDSTLLAFGPPINGAASEFVNKDRAWSATYNLPKEALTTKWLRVAATFRASQKEWTTWWMPRMVVTFQKDGQTVKRNEIKLFRFMADGETKEQYIDVKTCKKPYDTVFVQFWNGDNWNAKNFWIDDLKVEVFN